MIRNTILLLVGNNKTKNILPLLLLCFCKIYVIGQHSLITYHTVLRATGIFLVHRNLMTADVLFVWWGVIVLLLRSSVSKSACHQLMTCTRVHSCARFARVNWRDGKVQRK